MRSLSLSTQSHLRRIRALFGPLNEYDYGQNPFDAPRRHQPPFFHVVVTDSSVRQGGSSLELVGYFNPVGRARSAVEARSRAHRSLAGGAGAQQSGSRAQAGCELSPASVGAGRRRLSRYLVLGRVVAALRGACWVKVMSYTEPPDSLLQHRQWRCAHPEVIARRPESSGQVLQDSGTAMSCVWRSTGSAIGMAPESLREWEIDRARGAAGSRAARVLPRGSVGFYGAHTDGVVLGSLQQFLSAPSTW